MGTAYRVCIPRGYWWKIWGTLRCDGYGTYLPCVFLGTTGGGELYLLLYVDLNTGGSLRLFR